MLASIDIWNFGYYIFYGFLALCAIAVVLGFIASRLIERFRK